MNQHLKKLIIITVSCSSIAGFAIAEQGPQSGLRARIEDENKTQFKGNATNTKPFQGLNGMNRGGGVLGTITAISSTTITLQPRNNGSQDALGKPVTVTVASTTRFRGRAQELSLSGLKVGETILVQGTFSSTTSSLEARMIAQLALPLEQAKEAPKKTGVFQRVFSNMKIFFTGLFK